MSATLSRSLSQEKYNIGVYRLSENFIKILTFQKLDNPIGISDQGLPAPFRLGALQSTLAIKRRTPLGLAQCRSEEQEEEEKEEFEI